MKAQRTTPLQRERDRRGLSRTELARLVLDAMDDQQRPGLRDMATNIRRWEDGTVETPRPHFQRACATALGVPRRTLFPPGTEPNAEPEGSLEVTYEVPS